MKTPPRFICLSFAATLLTACVGQTPRELKGEGDFSSLTVDDPPGVTYRRVVEGARACYERIFDITADYFPDEKSGRVSASMKTTFTMGTAVVIEIEPSGTGSALRVVSHRSATGIPSSVRSWLNGNYESCDLKKE